MYVEDKVSHRGPFPIDVTASQTVIELKRQIAKEFEIPTEVQRWILGKELVTDDTTTLKDHKITEGCPVFLYLVAPGEFWHAIILEIVRISSTNYRSFFAFYFRFNPRLELFLTEKRIIFGRIECY